MKAKRREQPSTDISMPRLTDKSTVIVVSVAIHIALILSGATVTVFYAKAQEEPLAFVVQREQVVQEFEYDPELERAIFKAPRILADRLVERPIIMLDEEIELHDVPKGTGFDNLGSRGLMSTSVCDAYGVGGGACGAYGQRWGKGSFDDGKGNFFFLNDGDRPFIATSFDHLSTFAADVDTASYTIARSNILQGKLPPKKGVRIEEFVNYMKYAYQPPYAGEFAIRMEAAPSKFGHNDEIRLLRIGIKGKEIYPEERKSAVITFVIDVSGSMQGENRLGLVKKSLLMMLDEMRPDDRIGIVIYGSEARLITEPLGFENKDFLVEAVKSVRIEGSTNTEAGLVLGYKTAADHFQEGVINRVVLCSDGVANTGTTEGSEILKRIAEYAKKGIYLSTIGFGMGSYNDELMETLADKGDGQYAYIDNMKEAELFFSSGFVAAIEPIAKDMKIQVDFNAEVVKSFRLLGYENRRLAHKDFKNDAVDAGEVNMGHAVTALYELKLQEDVSDGRIASVSIRYKNPDNIAEVKEMKKEFFVCNLNPFFERTSADFRLAVAAAEFAEILSGSFFAKDSSLETVAALADEVALELYESAQAKELAELARKANEIMQKEEFASLEK
ncbi:MAG: vWA domain-containing protein [Planctomycetota bacterium]|jgi:Ca-activated chloride channel family protein